MDELENLNFETRLNHAFLKVAKERYPIVIELAGMPRLGKTTVADSLVDLINHTGLIAALSHNATHSSPINDRWSPEFSKWTLISFVKDYLENRNRAVHFLIADRGLFDSIVWLRIKQERGQLPIESLKVLRDFALIEQWSQSISCILAFVGETDLVLERRLYRKLYRGSSDVSNKDVLDIQRRIIEAEAHTWIKKGVNVNIFQASDEPINKSNQRALEIILDSLENYV